MATFNICLWLSLMCHVSFAADLREQPISLDLGDTQSVQLTGKYAKHPDCTTLMKPYCVVPTDCGSSCGAECGIGIVPNSDEPSTYICDVTCDGGLYADHTNHVCTSECPLGALKTNVDTNGDGTWDLFDCSVCGKDELDETVQLFADRRSDTCVPACPAGSVESFVDSYTVNETTIRATYDCSYCDDELFADHESNECRTNIAAANPATAENEANLCPPGSMSDDENNDCKRLCPPDGDITTKVNDLWDSTANETGVCVDECEAGFSPMTFYKVCTACGTEEFSDHDDRVCQSAAADCPTGSTADDQTNDCQHTCPPNNPTQKHLIYFDSAAFACVAACPQGMINAGAYAKCSACLGATYADHTMNTCVERCPPGSVRGQPAHWDSSAIECHQCGAGLLNDKPYAFKDPTNLTCVENCPSVAVFRHEMDCMAACPSGMAPNGTDECREQIYSMCDCNHCPSGTWADHDSHICVATCPNGTLSYKTPKDCVEKCPTGHVPKGGLLGRGIAEVPAGEDYQECQVCEKGTAADRELEVCVEKCPEGTQTLQQRQKQVMAK